jgi:hypothetical protein
MPSKKRFSDKIVNSKKTGPAKVTYSTELWSDKGRGTMTEVSKKKRASVKNDYAIKKRDAVKSTLNKKSK